MFVFKNTKLFAGSEEALRDDDAIVTVEDDGPLNQERASEESAHGSDDMVTVVDDSSSNMPVLEHSGSIFICIFLIIRF